MTSEGLTKVFLYLSYEEIREEGEAKIHRIDTLDTNTAQHFTTSDTFPLDRPQSQRTRNKKQFHRIGILYSFGTLWQGCIARSVFFEARDEFYFGDLVIGQSPISRGCSHPKHENFVRAPQVSVVYFYYLLIASLPQSN